MTSFYQINFHFPLTSELSDDWAVLNAGNVEIAFHRIGNAYQLGEPGASATGTNTKLVIEIKDDMANFLNALMANSVAVKEVKTFPGIDYVFCDGSDPEGNVFQISKQL